MVDPPRDPALRPEGDRPLVWLRVDSSQNGKFYIDGSLPLIFNGCFFAGVKNSL